LESYGYVINTPKGGSSHYTFLVLKVDYMENNGSYWTIMKNSEKIV